MWFAFVMVAFCCVWGMLALAWPERVRWRNVSPKIGMPVMGILTLLAVYYALAVVVNRTYIVCDHDTIRTWCGPIWVPFAGQCVMSEDVDRVRLEIGWQKGRRGYDGEPITYKVVADLRSGKSVKLAGHLSQEAAMFLRRYLT